LRLDEVQQQKITSTSSTVRIARPFGEDRPVRGAVDDDGHEFLAQKPAGGVLLFDQHQHHVAQRGFRDRHRSGGRMQDADPDFSIGSRHGQRGNALARSSFFMRIPLAVFVHFARAAFRMPIDVMLSAA
jgi:hypothetical protein